MPARSSRCSHAPNWSASGRMTPRHYVAMSPRMTVVASSARMCAVLPGNADTSSKSTITAHHTAPLRPAMRQSSSAGRSRCAVSPAVARLAEQMHRQQRRAEMPFDRSARGARDSQLAGNSTGTIAAFMTRDLREAQRCKAARRTHVAIRPSTRTARGTGYAPHVTPHPRTPTSPPRALRSAIKIPARFRVRGPSDTVTVADLHSAAVTRHYAAASFSFFSARAFTRTLAGFAGNQRSSPVNGSLPKRFFFAGTTCAVIFSRPGSVNSPAPFL